MVLKCIMTVRYNQAKFCGASINFFIDFIDQCIEQCFFTNCLLLVQLKLHSTLLIKRLPSLYNSSSGYYLLDSL